MRRARIVLLSLALLVGTAPLAWGTAERKAALRFTATAPVKVRGTSFRARELVKVTVSQNGDASVKRVRASAIGAFSVAFQDVTVTDRCNSDVWARAAGARGSVATAKLPQLQCPPLLRQPTP